jgi:hypothetical protein
VTRIAWGQPNSREAVGRRTFWQQGPIPSFLAINRRHSVLSLPALLKLTACSGSGVCVQGDDVDILIITKEGIKLDKLELKRD